MTYTRDPAFVPTVEQRANLAKLADYLAALPGDYDHFRMSEYYEGYDQFGDPEAYSPNEPGTPSLNECGACACAIGHGPSAGIPVLRSEHMWHTYALRVFGAFDKGSTAGAYMFGSNNPDDPHAAADRIREVLAAHGEVEA